MSRTKATDADVQSVLAYMRLRAPHAVYRDELAAGAGVSDRRARAALRRIDLETDWLVVPEPSGGYRLSDNPADLNAAAGPLRSRVAKLEERIEAIEAKVRRLERKGMPLPFVPGRMFLGARR